MEKTKTLLETLRDLSILTAIYLYFCGWIFIYYYYDEFGIALSSLDIPAYYFLVYSFSVIGTFAGIVAAIGLIIVGFALQKALRQPFLASSVALVAFPIIFVISQSAGLAAARETRFAYARPVRLSLKAEGEKSAPSDFASANAAGSLRLIAQTKDRYFVFVQPQGDANEREMPRGATFDISRDQVVMVSLTLENARK